MAAAPLGDLHRPPPSSSDLPAELAASQDRSEGGQNPSEGGQDRSDGGQSPEGGQDCHKAAKIG